MIIEGIITTEDDHGNMHVAPIGPHVDELLQSWVLKPFKTSTTFANLVRSNRGVFHVVDDSLLLVRAVLGYSNRVGHHPAARLYDEIGWVLTDACRAFPLRVSHWDTQKERAEAICQVGKSIELRAFWGWNRAVHSLIEMSVLWSRRHLMDIEELCGEFQRHRIIVHKTAGAREIAALSLLEDALGEFIDGVRTSRDGQ